MTATANRSSGSMPSSVNSGPYIGSLISLVSKSEIRYEGILYGVDTNESTIALSKVRSYGTEDRHARKPVAQVNELFEYIIFKASDIKDLTVCEQPPSRHQVYNDPAVVSVKQGGETRSNGHGMQPRATTPSTVGAAQQQQSMYPPSYGNGGFSPEYPPRRRSLLEGMSQQQAMAHSRGGIPPPLMPPPFPHHGMHPSYMSARGGYRAGNVQGARNGGRYSANDGTNSDVQEGKAKHKYLDDYDFEKAEADYKTVEEKLRQLAVTEDDEGTEGECYNKKKSFFDSISTDAAQHAEHREAAGGQEGQRLFQAYRHQNAETFGVAALRAHVNAMQYRNQSGYHRRYHNPANRYNSAGFTNVYPPREVYNPYYEYMQQQPSRPRSYYHSRRNTVGSTAAAAKKAAANKKPTTPTKAEQPESDGEEQGHEEVKPKTEST